MPTLTRSKKVLFSLVLALLSLVLVEIASLVLLPFANRRLDEPIRRPSAIYDEQTRLLEAYLDDPEASRTVFDHELGWRYRRGFSSETDAVSLQGLRGVREYSQRPDSGVLRVAAFGDSFVYANEVEHEEAWSAVLEQSHANVEVLNYGVGGYGTDQAWLRFGAEGLQLSPDIVLIGFVPVNLRRIVNVYRRFISTSESPVLWKPRFVLRDDTLALLPNPIADLDGLRLLVESPARVERLGTHDQWYEPLVYESPAYELSAAVRLATTLWIRIGNRYLRRDRLMKDGLLNPESTAFRIQLEVLRAFCADVTDQGARPIVVFFPDRESLARIRNGEPPSYQPLADSVLASGLEIFDLREAFADAGGDEGLAPWFAPGGHYSPAGNEIVARWLGRMLLGAAAEGASP